MSLILGNLVLVQCQGIVVGFLASLAGIAMGWIPVGKYFLSLFLWRNIYTIDSSICVFQIMMLNVVYFYLESKVDEVLLKMHYVVFISCLSPRFPRVAILFVHLVKPKGFFAVARAI